MSQAGLGRHMLRGTLALALFHFGVSSGPVPMGLRLREALLQEARERLTAWYEDKDSLELPFWRDGSQVQMSKGECLCDSANGDDKVPLTFGQFDVPDARPVDIFNVLADTRTQTDWDPTVSQVKEIPGDWPREDGVRGLEMLYPTGIILVPDREVFEWVAYSADFEKEEFWVVYSTLDNERLHQAMERASSSVPAQNCLGGYWIRKAEHGGAHVLFTQHVNPHPPMMLSAKFVFHVSWGKQIDYINILKEQAQKQAKLEWAGNRTVLSQDLLREPAASKRPVAKSELDKVRDGVFAKIDASFFRLWGEARPSTATTGRGFWMEVWILAFGLFAASLVAITATVLALRRHSRPLASVRRAALPLPEEDTLLKEPAEA